MSDEEEISDEKKILYFLKFMNKFSDLSNLKFITTQDLYKIRNLLEIVEENINISKFYIKTKIDTRFSRITKGLHKNNK